MGGGGNETAEDAASWEEEAMSRRRGRHMFGKASSGTQKPIQE